MEEDEELCVPAEPDEAEADAVPVWGKSVVPIDAMRIVFRSDLILGKGRDLPATPAQECRGRHAGPNHFDLNHFDSNRFGLNFRDPDGANCCR